MTLGADELQARFARYRDTYDAIASMKEGD